MILGLFLVLTAAFSTRQTLAFTANNARNPRLPTTATTATTITATSTIHTRQFKTTALAASQDSNNNGSKLPFWLDPGTKGGALVLTVVLFVVPIAAYNILLAVMPGVDSLQLGINIGVGFTVLALVGWMGTYIFRVATKDMTYAQQLKDYENAVIAKRLEELDEDEVQALVEEVEKDDF